jgi:hypothetical protein
MFPLNASQILRALSLFAALAYSARYAIVSRREVCNIAEDFNNYIAVDRKPSDR